MQRDAGDAEAALHAPGGGEGARHDLALARRDALERQHLAPRGPAGLVGAGGQGPAVDQGQAAAALPLGRAAVLHRRDAAALAQRLQQRLAGPRVDLAGPAVQGEAHAHGCSSGHDGRVDHTPAFASRAGRHHDLGPAGLRPGPGPEPCRQRSLGPSQARQHDLRTHLRRDAGPRDDRPGPAGQGQGRARTPARPPQPLEPVVEGGRHRPLHGAARGPHGRARTDRRDLGAALPHRLAQGRAGLLDPGREAARGALRAGRADPGLPLHGQLRHRRGLGGPAHGLPLAGGAARGDERRALREDPRLRGRGHRHAGQRVERQGDLRQGARAARRAGEPHPQPVRGTGQLPLPLPLHRRRGPGGRGRAGARGRGLRLGHGLGRHHRRRRRAAPAPPGPAHRGGRADAVPHAATTWASAPTASRASATST